MSNRRIDDKGYVLIQDPSHPLANKSGAVAEHRAVFYDAHGMGPFACEHCGCTITLKTGTVDHLNHIRTDNGLENLVPSCRSCNVNRHKKRLSYAGMLWTWRELSEAYGINESTLYKRVKKHGWPLEKALGAS